MGANLHTYSIILMLIVQQLHHSNGANCPPDWTAFNNHCYLYVEKDANWLSAERDCEGRGADLVSIHSSEENEFITNMTDGNERVWIGLDDIAAEGDFTWSDGSHLNFTNWGSNQPDNANDDEHCVHLKWRDPGIWNDFTCRSTNPFLGQWNVSMARVRMVVSVRAAVQVSLAPVPLDGKERTVKLMQPAQGHICDVTFPGPGLPRFLVEYLAGNQRGRV
ncbi:galactose-specific lectin nattectin-like [Amphiura filiformis]|uniref:galactose-specific lectin nattectin-like n=1 Tax=Amphiura filiformis TaxID=82378 RepID=UPI003B225F29